MWEISYNNPKTQKNEVFGLVFAFWSSEQSQAGFPQQEERILTSYFARLSGTVKMFTLSESLSFQV